MKSNRAVVGMLVLACVGCSPRSENSSIAADYPPDPNNQSLRESELAFFEEHNAYPYPNDLTREGRALVDKYMNAYQSDAAGDQFVDDFVADYAALYGEALGQPGDAVDYLSWTVDHWWQRERFFRQVEIPNAIKNGAPPEVIEKYRGRRDRFYEFALRSGRLRSLFGGE